MTLSFTLPEYRLPVLDVPALAAAPDVRLLPAPAEGVAPAGYHSTSIFPEYFKLDGRWVLAGASRMDCCVVLEGGSLLVRELRRLRAGDAVVVGRSEDGSEGIYVYTEGFPLSAAKGEAFAFRTRRSRESGQSGDYRQLAALLEHERAHGHIVWVLGPACVFDGETRAAFAEIIKAGYVGAVLAGNALATHDLEAAWLGTALGQDVSTGEAREQGHYCHLDTINEVRRLGSIPAFVRGHGLSGGVVASCVEAGVPLVLCGSIRDDGPLPEVFTDTRAAQDAMRAQLSQATTVLCLATTLHTIAASNITPSFCLREGRVRPVYLYSVDVSEFSLGKLTDRGGLSARTLVSNVQDFMRSLRACLPQQ